MLVVEVDVVGAEPAQRALHGGADIGGTAVEVPRAVSRVRDQAELGGEHDLVAAAFDRPADEFFVDVRTVDLGGVDEVHAQVECAVDGPDRFVVVGSGAGVAVGHAHGAQSDAGDVQIAELGILHHWSLSTRFTLRQRSLECRRASRRAHDPPNA